MKKIFTLIAASIILTTGFSQDSTKILTSKKNGIPILPQKGNWAFGLDASPFFNYLGNFFNNSTYNNSPYFRSALSPSLTFKYMKSNHMAYRFRFTLNNTSQDGQNEVTDVLNPNRKVIDKKTYTTTDILFGFGMEKRRGNGRLQGIYGVEGFIGILSNKSDYSYGNQITPTNPVVPLTFWNSNGVNVAYPTIESKRLLKSASGTGARFGATGFVGFEYFFLPKISVGGELGYQISFLKYANGKVSDENFNFTSNKVEVSNSNYTQYPKSVTIGTVPSANINFIVYF